MKHPLWYRYIRLWHKRHGAALRRAGGYSVCLLGGGVLVVAVGGRLVRVMRA
ncbi:hypothetical protein [Hymenobacter lapidiphilus]|uniref:Uncharacterized protein n=1 Tax=Hymenobacter lapidiphilus TaxID=2608003 RepID=A0A7Y7PSH7_9BACT|nr:hypothetical protein [Hymenobacter lapidiphilus]NVO33219.1 hypothetical protein [Hymenobacter lapidiphilus]